MPVPNCFAFNSLALDLLAFLKTQKGKVREDAEAALTWLDSITSNAVGSVVIQNTGETFLSWKDAERMLPDTMSLLDTPKSDDMAAKMNELKMSSEMSQDPPSSPDSLTNMESPQSNKSRVSSTSPDTLEEPKAKEPARLQSISDRLGEPALTPGPTKPKRRTSAAEVASSDETSCVPPDLQPLFCYVIWQLASPLISHSSFSSILFVTNDYRKLAVARKLGIPAHPLDQLRELVLREERDFKNRELLYHKEHGIPPGSSPSAPKPRQIALNRPGRAREGLDTDDDEVVLFKRSPVIVQGSRGSALSGTGCTCWM